MKIFMLVILLAIVISLPVNAQADNSLITEDRINVSFDEAVEKISTTAEKLGWKVPAVHDLKKSLSNSGMDVLPVKVIEICNPQFSGRILSQSDERLLSALMPCRISVYEKEDGNIYISRLNTSSLSGFSESATEAMTEALNEIEQILSDMIIK
jgi:uncharacterized protein (DUF302 family)